MNTPQARFGKKLLGGLLALSFSLASNIAMAADTVLQSITFAPGTGFVVGTSGSVKANINTVTLGSGKRIILDLENAEIGTDLPRDQILLKDLSTQWPQVRNVSVNQFGGARPVVRILVDVDGDFNVRAKNTKANEVTLFVEGKQGSQLSFAPKNVVSANSAADVQALSNTIQQQGDTIRQLQAELAQARQNASSPVTATADSQELQGARITIQDQSRLIVEQRAEMERQRLALDEIQRKLDMASQQAAMKQPAGVSEQEYQNVLKALQEQTRTVNQQKAELAGLQSQLANMQLGTGSTSADIEEKQRLLATLDFQKSQLEDQKKQLDTLQAQVKAMPSASAANPAEMTRLQAANQSLQDQIFKLMADQSALRQQNDDLKTALNQSKQVSVKANTGADADAQAAELGRLRAKVSNLETSLNRTTLENSQLKNQLANVKPTASTISPTMTEQQYAQLKSQLEEAKNALGRSVNTINRQNQEIQRLKADAEQISTNVDTSMRDQITTLNKQVEEKNTQISTLQTQMQALQQDLEARQNSALRAATLESQLTEKNNQIAQLKTQMLVLQGDLTQRTNDAQDVKALETQLSARNDRIQTLEGQTKALSEELQKQQGRVSELNSQLALAQSQPVPQPDTDLTQKVTMLTQQVNDSESRIKTLQGDLAARDKMIADLKVQASANASASTNDALIKQVADSEARIAALQNEIDQREKTITHLNSQLADVQTANAMPQPIDPLMGQKDAQAEVRQLREQLAQQEARHKTAVAEFNRQLQEARGGNKGESADVSKLNARIKTLETDLAAANSKYDKALRDFNYSKTDEARAEEARKAEEATRKYEERIAALEEELNKAVANTRELQNNLQDTQSALKTTQDQLASAQGELKSAQGDLTTTRQALQAVESQPDQTQALTELKTKNTELSTQLSAQKELAAKQANEFSALQDRNKILEQELATAKENNPATDALAAENIALKADLKNVLEEKNKLSTNFNEQQQSAEAMWQKKLTMLESDLADTQKKLDAARSKKPAKVDDKEVAALNEKYENAVQELARVRDERDSMRKQLKAETSASANAGVATDNSDAEKHFQLGKDFETAGQKDLALEEYERATALEPKNAKYLNAMATLLADQKQYDEAARLLTAFVQKDPYNQEAYNQLGKIYLLDDKADPAREAFGRAIPINVLNNYAYALRKQGRNEEAEQVFKFALTVSPYDSEVLFNLGTLYNANNNLQGAKESYTEALRIKPDFAEAHYNLGLVLSKMGDKQNAVNHLEKFLQLEPNARNADVIRSYVDKLKS